MHAPSFVFPAGCAAAPRCTEGKTARAGAIAPALLASLTTGKGLPVELYSGDRIHPTGTIAHVLTSATVTSTRQLAYR